MKRGALNFCACCRFEYILVEASQSPSSDDFCLFTERSSSVQRSRSFSRIGRAL